MTCQARIPSNTFAFETFYNVAECGKPSVKRISIDDGDAEMHICIECFKRFLTKKRDSSTWYGWFDCEIPSTAPVRGSKAFYDAVTKAYRAAHPTTPDGYIPPSMLNTWLEKQREEIQAHKELTLEEQIATLKAWLDGPGKTAKLKEQLPKHRELLALRTKLQAMTL